MDDIGLRLLFPSKAQLKPRKFDRRLSSAFVLATMTNVGLSSFTGDKTCLLALQKFGG